MKADSGHWVVFGAPASPAEDAALATLRELLPDTGITQAWANLTFVGNDGRASEIDVLLLTRSGLFLVELKGWHGAISGNSSTWLHQIGAAVHQVRNPYITVDSKAKRLASLLKDTAARIPGKPQIPFLKSIVVLHGQKSVVTLDEGGRTGVWALDGYNVQGLGPDRNFSDFLLEPPAHPGDAIDGPRANQIRKVAEQAGFVAIPKIRMAGQYPLDKTDPLSEGQGWQDVLATHPTLGVKRRIRLFDVPRGASAEARTEIEQGAKREYLLTQGFNHPGIVAPVEHLDTDTGPALVFNFEPDAVPLDAFMAGPGAAFGLDERLALIRKIAEVLRYAHGRNLAHRALTPRQVFVRTTDRGTDVSIRDWMTGRKQGATSTTSLTVISGGVDDVAKLIAAESWIYLPPETLNGNPGAPVIPLDVYGLGALSYLVLTGRPPVSTIKELQERFADSPSFNPLAVSPELLEPFAQVVERATRFAEADRTSSVEIFLQDLDQAIDDATEPVVDSTERPVPRDPLDAEKGSLIANRFEVLERRGSGSTGSALCVDDYVLARGGLILKLARDDAAASRIEVEAETLRALDHPRIARLVEGPIDVDGRVGILMTDAGRETLADRLQTEGRSTIEQLEQYGDDLLEAMRYLETEGIYHRDIKPANLAISPDPGTRKPRLTLFDLSLSKEPVQNIASGSRPYLDPFLGRGRRRQYDRAAELYAVAVTLFEMAAAAQPWWEQGDAAPVGDANRVVLVESIFEASVAPTLVRFFTKAFAPDAAARFSNATDMSLAWREVFAQLGTTTESERPGEADSYALAAAAQLDTLLEESGLSPRAISGVARLGVRTVGELLGRPSMEINSIRGLGERYRKEVQRRIRQWNPRLRSTTQTPEVAGSEQRESVERRIDRLIPRRSAQNDSEVAALHLVLGKPRDIGEIVPEWPTHAVVGAEIGVTAGRVSQLLDAATKRWRRSGTLTPVVDDVVRIIVERGHVATLDEVAAALLLGYGSAVEGENRLRRATGLVRAAVEMDSAASAPQLAVRRSRAGDGAILLAVTDSVQGGTVGAPADVYLSAARKLGTVVDASTVEHEITAAAVIRAALRRTIPDDVVFDDQRLLQLAAASSSTGALSSLGELYRRDLDPSAAVQAALSGIAVRELTEHGIRRRVHLRFPLVERIPARPGLDAVVQRTHPHFVWHLDRYTARDTTGSRSASKSFTRLEATPTPEIDRALDASLVRRSALTLAAHPRQYTAAARVLEGRYGVQCVDLADELVCCVHALAVAKKANWDVLLRADSQDEQATDFQKLSGVVGQAMRERWRDLSARPEPLLFINAAPLARYGLTELLAEPFDLARPRPAARWFLVPFRPSQPAPDLDGHPFPFGSDKWLTLPHDLRELIPRSTGDTA
jgi:serine/threonine protein kinase